MKDKYIEDLKDIKQIMARSSRFISLSGIAGISAGIIALIGAYLAHTIIFKNQDYLSYHPVLLPTESMTNLLLIATTILFLSIGTTFYFTSRETEKRQEKVWNNHMNRLIINLLIPLITGGILCLMLLSKGFNGMIFPLSLIFYGLALVNASKYTLTDVRVLGVVEIVTGLIAFQYIEMGLLFWSIGFGIMHILFGTIMQWKYKS